MPSHPQNSRFSPPKRGSIHAILVSNPSKRLYTNPLEWKEQLEHLSCELHPPALSLDHKIVGDEAMQNVFLTHGSEWNDIRGAVIEIQDCRKRKSRDEQMRNLFAKLSAAATGLQLQSDYVPFQYDGRTVAEIRLPLVFCDQQSTQDLAWAYIDGTWSSEQRYNFHSRRKRSFSYATRAVHDVKDLPLDPLYVAILIALAQKSRGTRPPRASKTPEKVSLFVPEHTAGTSSTDKQSDSSGMPQALITSLKQYTATITDEYLQKFDDPYHFHDSALHIHQESFPIDLPSTMFQAIQAASRAQNLSLVPSTIDPQNQPFRPSSTYALPVNGVQGQEPQQMVDT
ncbi:hypothetical protein BDZ45DRAFT_692215 [Acephala macrosclerotiorum]|nr:hypothetical protein BDZ45DRAFT_692215 [Acephala macrosclerotiorum]